MPIIEVDGLTYCYEGSRSLALDDVNLKVEGGEYLVITGPSGCGKTTLCRCLNGLIPHSYSGGFMRGRVVVKGLDTSKHPTYELAQYVGLVFQDPENQLLCLTVEREVAFGLENLALPRQEIVRRVEDSLSLVGIKHLRNKSPYELSGGEQQKVAIASCLAIQPEILVLDEPTSNLDPKSAEEILSLLFKLNTSLGMTVILVEHRLEMVSSKAGRLVLMDRGRVVLDGEPREVLTSDLAEGLGIGVPKIVSLYKELSKAGVKLPRTPLSALEASLMIREALA